MGSKFNGSPNQIVALNSFIKFFRASEVVKSKISLITNSYGYSDGQFYVLDVLYHLGSLPQKKLAEKIMRTEGNLTMIINNLLKRKVIKKTKSKEDGRIHMISLTDRGKIEFEKIFPAVVNEIESLFISLDQNEKITLQNLCKRVGLSLKK